MSRIDRREMLYAGLLFIVFAFLYAALAWGQAPTDGLIVADDSEGLVWAEWPDPAEYWKTVTLSGDGYPCRIYEFVQVAAEVDEFLPRPDDPTAQMTPAIYWQPLSEADRLRAQADEIERRSAVLLHWRKVLAECKRAILGDKP